MYLSEDYFRALTTTQRTAHHDATQALPDCYYARTLCYANDRSATPTRSLQPSRLCKQPLTVLTSGRSRTREGQWMGMRTETAICRPLRFILCSRTGTRKMLQNPNLLFAGFSMIKFTGEKNANINYFHLVQSASN